MLPWGAPCTNTSAEVPRPEGPPQQAPTGVVNTAACVPGGLERGGPTPGTACGKPDQAFGMWIAPHSDRTPVLIPRPPFPGRPLDVRSGTAGVRQGQCTLASGHGQLPDPCRGTLPVLCWARRCRASASAAGDSPCHPRNSHNGEQSLLEGKGRKNERVPSLCPRPDG